MLSTDIIVKYFRFLRTRDKSLQISKINFIDDKNYYKSVYLTLNQCILQNRMTQWITTQKK